MKTKLLGLYWIVAFLLIGGIFCFFGFEKNYSLGEVFAQSLEENLNDESLKENEDIEISSNEVNSIWSDTFDSVSSYALSTTSKYGYTNAYNISSATDLAYLSYLVNNGTSTSGKVYIMTADIDLSGSLWTPIGTTSNPFQGIFIGDGHKISNIAINNYSVDTSIYQGSGLFGTTAGASICDIILSGWQQNISKTTYKGALIGYMNGGVIANCYDEAVKTDQNATTFSSIGYIAGSSYIFRGGSYNGSSANYTSSSAIAGTLTVASGSYTAGYVGYYKLNDGQFKKVNGTNFVSWTEETETEETETKETMCRVLLNSSYSAIGISTSLNHYHSGSVVLRENATSGQVFPLRQGYKATIPTFSSSSFSSSFIKTISWTSATTNVYLNHNYGTRGTAGNEISYTFGYDQTFTNFFANNLYAKNRVGYTLAGIYSDSGLTSAIDYQTTIDNQTFENGQEIPLSVFANANATYYFSWTADSGKNFYVRPAIASDEGGKFTSVDNCISKVSQATVEGAQNPKHNTTESTKTNYIFDNLSSGKVAFVVTLSYGYKIANVTSTNETTVTDNESSDTSGIYVNFINHTGTGSSYAYSADNLNNDDYNNANVSFTEDINGENQRVYTITLDGLVGEAGVLYLVIERIYVEIDVNINLVGIDAVDYSCTVISDFTQYDSENNKIFVKWSENPTVKFSISTANVFILDATTNTVYFTKTCEDKTSLGLDFYKTWEMTFYGDNAHSTGIADNGEINLWIGYLQTKIFLSLVDESGNALSDNDLTALYVQINGSANLQNVSSQIVNMAGTDIINVTKSGKYQAKTLKIVGGNTYNFDQHGSNLLAMTLSDNLFSVPYKGGDKVVYNLEIYFAVRTFSVTYEYYFDGVKYSPSNLTTYTPSNLTGQYGQTIINSYFNLSTIGKGSFLFEKSQVVNMVGDTVITSEVDGFSKGSISGTMTNGRYDFTLNLGTYDTVVKFYFVHRNVSLLVNSLYVKDNESIVDLASFPDIMVEFNPTLSFNYDGSTLKLSGDLGSISIHSQYYLIGWYLKNGEVVTVEEGAFNYLLTNSAFVEAIASEGAKTSTSTFTYNNIKAEVGIRYVNVSYNAGEAGYGRLYKSDKTTIVNSSNNTLSAGRVKYNQELTLNTGAFYNLGYKFSTFSSDVNCDNNKLSNNIFLLSGLDWYRLFSAESTGLKTWGGFATSQSEKEQDANLTFNWQIISYVLSVDGILQKNISIGQNISFTTNETLKNGQADYTIERDSFKGSQKNGYVVTGFKLSQGGDLTFTQKGVNLNLTPDNFLSFIANDYKFNDNSNENAILLTTLRNPATYTIYLDNSANGYYSYGWTEGYNQGYGSISAQGIISIIAIYDSLPTNLTNALESKTLTVTRKGYTLAGWAISNNGVQTSVFDTNLAYTDLSDIHIVPIWSLASQTSSSIVAFNSDVGTLREFMLATSHDIITGNIAGDNVKTGDNVTNKNLVLANGEVVTNYKFIVTQGQTTTEYSTNIFNINQLKLSGSYTIKFSITIKDSLNILSSYPAGSYTVESATLSFNMNKNELYFYQNDLHTIYNGTSEFVGNYEGEDGINNDFGLFIYRYDWNGVDLSTSGADLTENGIGKKVENYFNTFSVIQNDDGYNAGSGKTLKMALISNLFDGNGNELFSNVSLESGKYYTQIANQLTIDKAKFTITFPSGSAYYIAGIETLVYQNDRNETFTIGSVTFTYTYQKITLPFGSLPGVYQGNESYLTDKLNFKFTGLSISGHADDFDKNFEWNISKESIFKLLDVSSALQLDYSPKYLVARGGQLNGSLDSSYNGIVERMVIEDIVINGETQTIPNSSQFSLYAGNNVIITVAGNGGEKIYAYVSKTLLSEGETISFKIRAVVDTSRSGILKTLCWQQNTLLSGLADKFEQGVSGDYSTTITPNSGESNKSNFIVLTDVTRANIDYNGGVDANGNSTKTIYISASEGGLTLSNPEYIIEGVTVNGMIFNGYKLASQTRLTCANSTNSTIFTSAGGGKSEKVIAQWTFASIDASLLRTQHNFYASKNGINLPIDDIVTINEPKHITARTFTLSSGGKSYQFSNVTNSFTIANEDGLAIPSMSGNYTISMTLTYSDGVTSPQTITNTLTFAINITINTIDITHDGSHLTYNNTNQEAFVVLKFMLNGSEDTTLYREGSEGVSLSEISTTDNPLTKYNVYANYSPIKNAGVYNITFKINDKFLQIYQFSDKTSQKSLEINVDKYTINLVKYNQSIDLYKFFGMADPNPIYTKVKIVENANEEVTLEFTRVEGEAIGEYPLTFDKFSYEKDECNYQIDSTDFDSTFKIVSPNYNLKVEFKSIINYIYNGYSFSEYTISYNGTNYTLTGKAGSESYSTTFDLYYLYGDTRVDIPERERDVYATYLSFSCPNIDAIVGEYYFVVSLTENAGEDWTGVDIVNSELAKIVVEKRIITITSITKVFNGDNTIVFNTINDSANNCEMNISNISIYPLGGCDQLQLVGTLSSEVVGQRRVTEIHFDESEGRYNCYTIQLAQNLLASVLADNETEITITTSINEIEYGKLSNTSTIANLQEVVEFIYNDGNVDTKYIDLTAFSVNNATYSNGGYLKAGSYDFVLSLSSVNFTFKNSRNDSLSYQYTTTRTITLTITQKDITITNSTLKISKEYDGYNNVLSLFVGGVVNGNNAYYLSDGILNGDFIKVLSATYENQLIGTNKIITLTFGSDDNLNYNITQNVVGDITSVNLKFIKNGNTITFVDGEKEFENNSNLEIVYAGNVDNIINEILLQTNFLRRVGYKQIGYSYNSIDLSQMSQEEKAQFLQSAVDNKTNGLTIDAIWQINEVTLTIVNSYCNVYLNGEIVSQPIKLNYYDSIENLTIKANEGYTFEGYTSANANLATISITSGLNTSQGSLKIEHILDSFNLTILTEEIEVKIILVYNQPTGFNVVTDNTLWSGKKEMTLSYSLLAISDLPILRIEQENTYDFDYWTLNSILSEGNSIWERIDGKNLTSDNLTGYTFTAHWTECELSLNLTIDEHINLVVKLGEQEQTSQNNVIKFHYNDSLSFTLVADDWYKWSTFNLLGSVASISGDTTANNTKYGQFTLNTITTSLNLVLSASEIKLTINTSYVLPLGTTITENSGDIRGFVTISNYDNTLGSILGKDYSLTANTYYQDGWKYSETRNVQNSEIVKEFIVDILGGVPNSDETINLQAIFVGYSYQVIFDKGSEEGAEFTGNDAGGQTAVRTYNYGDIMNNIPIISKAGRQYIYKSQSGETFKEGSIFVTSLANSSFTITLTADWEYIPYTVTFEFSNNEDKIEYIYVDGIVFNGSMEVIYNSTKIFAFFLNKGYEINIDANSTKILSGHSDTTLTVTTDSITLNNIKDNTIVSVSIKAKDYTLTIVANSYENISETVYNISYDMNISSIFDLTTFTRGGYKIAGLKTSDENFATFSQNVWTFNENYVKNGLYKYEGDLTLIAVWDYDQSANYIQVTITPQSDLYYNGQSQTLVMANFVVNDSQTFALNTTFVNGDKPIEVYYMLGREKIISQSDFSLSYTDFYNGEVFIVALIQDIHTGQTHEVKSSVENAILNKSEVLIKNAVLSSYYSETLNYNPSPLSELGTLYFHDATTLNEEISIANVEIIDENGLYSVGSGYSVKYFFNSTNLFKLKNYEGLVQEGGFYTLTTENMIEGNKVTAEIVKTPITLSFNEQGYYNGKVQKIQNYSIQLPAFVSSFRVTVDSIYTSEVNIGTYDSQEQFTIRAVITNASGVIRNTNFEYVIDGQFKILGSDDANRIDIDAKYFNLSEIVDSEAIVKVSSFEYNGQTTYISTGEQNYIYNNKLIMTVTNNGSKGLYLQIAKGENVKINFTISSSMAVLTWTTWQSDTLSGLTQTLENLTSEASKSVSMTFTSSATYYAIVTDYKAVLMSLGDKGSDQGYLYIKLGENAIATTPENWIGFNFKGWESSDSSISIRESQISISSTAKITSSKIKAIWEIAELLVTTKDYSFDADVDLSATKEISFEDITEGGIENYNQELTYSYVYEKNGQVLAKNGNNVIVPANTDGQGQIKLTIIASKDGYTSVMKEVTFTITVNRLTLTSFDIDENTFTYSNYDYANDINVTFTGAGLASDKLANLLNKTNASYYFTLSGKDNGKLKDAGEYSLLLNVNEKVFDKENFGENFDYQREITISKADLIVTQNDIPLEKSQKLFGEDDPDFTIEKTMFGEVVSLSLEREQGENKGSYKFVQVTLVSTNYNPSIEEGTIFTIIQTDIELNIKIDNVISKVYSKTAPNFTLEFNQTAGQWIISLGGQSSTLTLSYFAGDTEHFLSGELYRNALNGITISSPSAIKVGKYSTFEVGGSGNFAGYTVDGKFEITPLALVILSVSKVFDRTDNIISDNVTFENLISGDNVILSGKYAQKTVGNNISLLSLTLTGSDSENYTISNSDFKGQITPKTVESVTLNLTKTTFTYGEISSLMTIEDLLSLCGYTLAIDGVTTDIANGYAKISSFVLDENYLSTSSHAKVGGVVIAFVITSDNFTGLNSQGYQKNVTIIAKELDLSSLIISKQYDGTTSLPQNLNTSLEGFIFEGDDAEIDLTRGGFDDANIGGGKHITILLTGEDSDCYIVLDNISGEISQHFVKLSVNATTENEYLVTDGAFVNDGESPIVQVESFLIGYPSVDGDEQLLASLTMPTRKGYRAVAWKYYDGSEYITITKDNLSTILNSVIDDQTNTENQLTIYVSWEIERYSVRFTSTENFNFTLSATPSNALSGDRTQGYTIKYYSDLNGTITASEGRKIKRLNLAQGNVESKDLSDLNKNEVNVSFSKILSDLHLEITFDDIIITFNIDANLPQYTTRIDNGSLSKNYAYLALDDKYKNDLSTLAVSEGTYYLLDYSYGETRIGTQTLKDVVDSLYSDIESDITINLAAIWQGESYIIIFDENGGTLSGQKSINAIYGSPITETFPTASLTGKINQWICDDGKSYYQNDILKSIGQKVDGIWTLTFTAKWDNATFILTVEFDDKITVYESGRAIASGKEYSILYNVDTITLNVESSQGYIYQLDTSLVKGQVTEENGVITICDLIKNGTLKINSLPDDNILTLTGENIDSIIVKIDDGEEEEKSQVTVKTESIVTIRLIAKKGYEFDANDFARITGSGTIASTQISQDKKTITFVWKDFIQDTNISVKAIASDNTITIGNVSSIFESLQINGKQIDLNGDSVTAKTGSEVLVVGIIKYGYKNGTISTQSENYVVEDSVTNTYLSDGYYHFTATLSAFDEDFVVIFSCTERQYNFAFSVKEGMENYGEITSQKTQTIDFGQTLTASQQELTLMQMFNGWEACGNIISTESTLSKTLNKDFKAVLESGGENGVINIFATYTKRLSQAVFEVKGRGDIQVSHEEEGESFTVESGQKISQSINIGQNILIKLIPDEGYEIDKALFDGEEINLVDYGYDEGLTLKVFMNITSPITNFEIIFKASVAEVAVRAGVRINYIDNLDNTAGGFVYLTDQNGERLGDENYLPNGDKFIIGGSYKVSTFTDETLYFVVDVKSGFEVNTVAREGMIINEYEVNGNHVYSFSGVKNGDEIIILFTAKTNIINIKFALEGSTDIVHGGTIAIDSSSNLVSASPNRGASLTVGVITGADLIADLKTPLSYKLLKDESGKVKYDIYYNAIDEGFTEEQISAGQVQIFDKENTLLTGFTTNASMTITGVDQGATIIIYVEPEEYSIRFNYNDEYFIELPSTVTYGRSWTLESLSEEDLEMLLAHRTNYTFMGYFTKPLGQGTQYVNGEGIVTSEWLENGYHYDGTSYVKDDNYNEELKQFTLYGYWVYDRANMTLSILPEMVTTINSDLSIKSFIANSDSLSMWLSQDNRWYAEITIGSIVQFGIVDFEGYKFVGWQISFNGGDNIEKGLTFSQNIEMGSYVITAKYKPLYNINILNLNNGKTDGGQSNVIQGGTVLDDGCFDYEQYVTLEAIPNEGYKFLYWINQSNGQKIYGNIDANGRASYTYRELISSPLDLTAVFTGKTVVVNLDLNEISQKHIVESVKINGKSVDYSRAITACVGDEITIVIIKSQGFDIAIEGATFELQYIDNYIYSHTFNLGELTVVDSETYLINIDFLLTREEILFDFDFSVENQIDNNEANRSGKVSVSEEGKTSVTIANGNSYRASYGLKLTIKFIASENYKISKVFVIAGGLSYDVSSMLEENILIFDENMYEMFFDYNICIESVFARLLWTDEDAIANSLQGGGTKDNPFLITNASEFGRMAYLVNSGASYNGQKYSEAYYKVTSDIDFTGRFWEPIGNKENPFNGTLDLGDYKIDNIVLYRQYTDPSTSYGGLIWCLGDFGKILEDKVDLLIIVLIIVISSILLLAGIVLIIFFIRRRKRKRLERISSN